MELKEAQILAETLMNQTFVVGNQGVCAAKLGYTFGWANSRRMLGQCNYTRKLVRLSKHYTAANDETLVKDTILHELAHVFNKHVYNGKGHGRSWKNVCVQVGAKPQRCKSEEDGLVVGGHKYVLRHVETKEVFGRFHKWPASTHRNLKNVYIRKRKSETLGKLELVGASEQ